MGQIKKYEEEMNQSIQRMIEKVKPLSEEVVLWKPSAEEWSVMEILCHVEEVITYWLNEFVRVVDAGGTAWGRGLDDPARVAAVAQANHRQVSDVLNGIEEARDSVKPLWERLTDQDLELEAPHRNPKFGVKPMSFLVEHFIVEHLQNHERQIERNLAKFN